jgi:hypothetical protein
MPGLKSDANFAIGFEAAYAWAMSGTRIDHYKGAAAMVNLYLFWWGDAHKPIVDGTLEGPSICNPLDRIIENVRYYLGPLLAILITALPHRIPKEHLPLSCVDDVTKGGVQDFKAAAYACVVMGRRHHTYPFLSTAQYFTLNQPIALI